MKYQNTIIDATTGDITVVPLTELEIAEKEAKIHEISTMREQAILEQKQKEEAKQSALLKLQALGLTEDEAKALIGV